jgi:dolichyl-phosphate beta-glucosyltransferase
VIVVLDGADTATAKTLGALAAPGTRVLVNERNRGKGFSVRRGMLEATGRIVVFTDADLSIPVESLHRAIALIDKGADVVIASRLGTEGREQGSRASGRRLMTRAFNALVQATFLPGTTDSQCGFKAFRLEAARPLFGTQRIDRFAFDVEVLWLARRWGFRVEELPVTVVYYSQSSVRRVLDSITMVRDLVRIRWAAIRGRYPGSAPAGRLTVG